MKEKTKESTKRTIWKELTVANGITFIRLLLTPLIIYFLFIEKNLLAIAFLTLALVSDAIDGYLARKLQQVSTFGKRFDQFTDKALLLSVLFTLVWREGSWIWAGIFGSTAFLAILLGIIITKKKLYVTSLNKITMWLQSVVLWVMVFGFVNDFMFLLLLVLLVIPAVDYLWRAFFVDKKKDL